MYLRLWMGDGKHFLAYPVRAGQLLNYAGFVPSGQQTRESWSGRGDPAALAAQFTGWDPVVAAIIGAAGGTGFRWGLYDRPPLRRWTRGRLTLLGDAAHPMLPYLAQGANQAIEDGTALATMLAATDRPGVPRALQAYETLRRDRTTRIQHDARQTGAIYDNSGNTPGSRHNQPRVRLPDRRWIYDYDIQAAATPVAAALAKRINSR